VEIESVSLNPASGKNWSATPDAATPKQIEPGKAADVRFAVKVPVDEPCTRPYFTRPDMEQPYYDIADKTMIDKPQGPCPLAADVHYQFEGLTFETANVVQVINKVTGPGTLRSPMPVGPAISLALSPSAGSVPLSDKSFPVRVRLHNNIEGPAKADVHLNLPDGWTSEPTSVAVAFAHLGEEQAVFFTISPKSIMQKPYEITAVAEHDGKQVQRGVCLGGLHRTTTLLPLQSCDLQDNGG
jgi:hypothetical protein